MAISVLVGTWKALKANKDSTRWKECQVTSFKFNSVKRKYPTKTHNHDEGHSYYIPDFSSFADEK